MQSTLDESMRIGRVKGVIFFSHLSLIAISNATVITSYSDNQNNEKIKTKLKNYSEYFS